MTHATLGCRWMAACRGRLLRLLAAPPPPALPLANAPPLGTCTVLAPRPPLRPASRRLAARFAAVTRRRVAGNETSTRNPCAGNADDGVLADPQVCAVDALAWLMKDALGPWERLDTPSSGQVSEESISLLRGAFTPGCCCDILAGGPLCASATNETGNEIYPMTCSPSDRDGSRSAGK